MLSVLQGAKPLSKLNVYKSDPVLNFAVFGELQSATVNTHDG